MTNTLAELVILGGLVIPHAYALIVRLVRSSRRPWSLPRRGGDSKAARQLHEPEA